MNNKAIILFFAGLLLYSCYSEKEEKNSIKDIPSPYAPSKNIKEIKKQVLEKGDTLAYYELKVAFMGLPVYPEVMVYSMIMANKYGYTQAFYDVYFCIKLLNSHYVGALDDETLKLGISYFFSACERGHHQANSKVKEYGINKYSNYSFLVDCLYNDR
jgi:hypothetical protein